MSNQGYNARKVNYSCVYSAYTLKPVLSGRNLLTRIDPSVFVLCPRRIKAFFENFDNSHNSFLRPEYFIDFYLKYGSHVRLGHRSCVSLPPRDSALQYKRCVHLWNKFPCIITLCQTINWVLTDFQSGFLYFCAYN